MPLTFISTGTAVGVPTAPLASPVTLHTSFLCAWRALEARPHGAEVEWRTRRLGRSVSSTVTRFRVHASTATPASSSSPSPSPSSSSSSSSLSTSSAAGTEDCVDDNDRGLLVRRVVVFGGMSVTYAVYVFLRSTFTYVAPVMAKALGLGLPAVGKITSAFPLAYGLSRLVTGVVVDRAAPHHALIAGLALAGAVNAAMGLTASVPALAALWALNGLVQGVGAGASAKMLTAWFPSSSRGRYWALWSTSANVGAFLAPVVCGRIAAAAGFQAGLLVPGVSALLWALVMLPALKSSPADAGYDVSWNRVESKPADTRSGNSASERNGNDNSNDNGSDKGDTQQDARSIFVEKVLKNKVIWCLASAYFFVYLIRSGTKSWLHFWLTQARGVGSADAAYRVSGMEVGGIAGTFSAGVVSDVVGGRRVLVTMAFLALVVGALIATALLPAGAPPAVYFAAFAAVGFAINGPQMMIGLVGAEACDRRVVATATGLLGCISYLGAAASGFPLSVAIRRAGWSAYFGALVASAAAAILCLVPMRGLSAQKQRSAGATTDAEKTKTR